MEREVTKLAKAGRAGVIIDTNLLIIYLVGLYRPECVIDVVTNKTQPEDFMIIRDFLRKFKFDKCIVTPHILTEASNHTFDKFNNSNRPEYVTRALSFIRAAREENANMTDLIDLDHLPKLGFADSSIVEVSKKYKYLVLTEDFHLAQRLQKENCLAINISHIRQLKMAKI
jgi:rRNA-processing protein FCF1